MLNFRSLVAVPLRVVPLSLRWHNRATQGQVVLPDVPGKEEGKEVRRQQQLKMVQSILCVFPTEKKNLFSISIQIPA